MLAAALMLSACTPHVHTEQDGQDHREQTEHDIGHTESVPHLRAHVIDVHPHDRSSFTQGLELADGTLYEGTGLRGESRLRAIDLDNGHVHRQARLPAELFGEGITVIDDRIWQLTWQEGVAIERDRHSLEETRRVRYSGEGWGLCHDGSRLVMSDGSSELTFRDPNSFESTGETTVTADGQEIDALNELECVDGQVWANVWGSDQIIRIDPGTGDVTTVVDASGLLTAEEERSADVLNGIAAIPGTDEYLLTGKNWPHVFQVRFGP